jgi:hypothetical protein
LTKSARLKTYRSKAAPRPKLIVFLHNGLARR